MQFAEVEEVKKEGKDFSMDIDIRPNRAKDCLSHKGVAREIGAILNLKLKPEIIKIKETKENAEKLFKVLVKDKKACPRYNARLVKNVKVSKSPEWIQERLKSCGLRPINNIVDATNYIMLETGQPLHVFDMDKIAGREIIVRKAKMGEKITSLDNEKYDLDGNILIIADRESPLAIAGIKGGKKAEIDSKTKEIVLEAANFNQQSVRYASKQIGLKTDSSLRFEHGIDPNITKISINKAAYLIQEIAGGEVYAGIIDVYPKKISPKKINLDLDYINSLLGVKVSRAETENILKRLEFITKRIPGNKLKVTVPTFRLDVSIQEDIIEDIGRIFGYLKVPSIFPLAEIAPPKRNNEVFWEDFTRDVLKEAGFNETINYSFISQKDLEIFGLVGDSDILELENPLSTDFKYLRPSLIPNILKNIEKNQKTFKNIKIFEFGKVFRSPRTETKMIAGAVIGSDFYEVKGAVEFLFNKSGIKGAEYKNCKATEKGIFIPEASSEIVINGDQIGFLGEISQQILKKLKIDGKVVAFDLNFEKLVKLSSEQREYSPIPKYPPALRDLAVLVPKTVTVKEVADKIRNSGKPLAGNVELFDFYEGKELPQGMKNLAFRVIYQSEEKTLNAGEIDQAHRKIIDSLEKESGWQVRK
ncbi:MAG: phenylalanine--tRNA ligase subunit beta [Candidatus Parcubacteria bacterium]|nr:phenylalanine--tRNA ligase subunit beta [Candidatus Parcubacteria bacterium]